MSDDTNATPMDSEMNPEEKKEEGMEGGAPAEGSDMPASE